MYHEVSQLYNFYHSLVIPTLHNGDFIYHSLTINKLCTFPNKCICVFSTTLNRLLFSEIELSDWCFNGDADCFLWSENSLEELSQNIFLRELHDLEIVFANCTTQHHSENTNSTALVSSLGLRLAAILRYLLSHCSYQKRQTANSSRVTLYLPLEMKYLSLLQ
jgi:hypothetical protein